MKVTIYRVPSSHPSEAVIKAARLKGIEPKIVDLPPGTQPIAMTLMFGERTVPAMKIKAEGAPQKVQTTAKCLRALDALVPEPPLFPARAGERERVLAAENWGLGELQNLARRVAWKALTLRPDSLPSFDSGFTTKLPEKLVVATSAPILWIERRMNSVTDDQVREDLERLPGYIDEIDDYISAGVIGGENVNAADLTVLSNVWLLRSFGDLKPFIDSRPAGRKSRELFGDPQGWVPEGVLPAAWLTDVNAARGAAVTS